MVKGGLGEAEQDALLATHPVQFGDQFPLHAVLSAGVDLVDQRDQQIDQPIGQLGGALPAQAGEQGQPHRPGCGAEVRRVHPGRPCPPGGDQLLGGAGEQLRRQPDRAHPP
jgi:hypothetical protein